MIELTNQTAIAYVGAHFTSTDYADADMAPFYVTHVTAPRADEIDIPAIDVHFVYGANNHAGRMTVWINEDGNLYGEW
jgi:hypothetical protein